MNNRFWTIFALLVALRNGQPFHHDRPGKNFGYWLLEILDLLVDVAKWALTH